MLDLFDQHGTPKMSAAPTPTQMPAPMSDEQMGTSGSGPVLLGPVPTSLTQQPPDAIVMQPSPAVPPS